MGLSSLETKACKQISEAELVDLTRLLIRVPSVSGSANSIADALASELQARGLSPTIAGPGPEWRNVVARVAGMDGSIRLLFSGHLDTVPVGVDSWRHDPFEAAVVDGCIFGRGAVDMKGGIAAIVSGAAAVARLGVKLREGFNLAFTSDEELGSIRGMKYLCEQDLVEGKVGIAAEPTSLEVQGWFKGRARYEIRTVGKAAHSSNPSKGINAIVHLSELVTRINRGELGQRKHPILGPTTVNIGIIEGGSDPNTVPESARAILEVRTVPGQTSETVLEQLRWLAQLANQEDPSVNATVDLLFAKEPIEVEQTAPIVETIRQVTTDLTGSPAAHGKEPIAGGDMYYARMICGTHGVDFGPGDLHLAHTTDENIRIDQLVLAAQAYAILILRVCGVAD